MRVEAINIGPSDAIVSVDSVRAFAGQGLQGDRHFRVEGARPGEALTLVEAEALEDVALTGAQSRRQVVVRGVRLNDLVGKRFRVGDVDCLGVRLCEPCLQHMRVCRVRDNQAIIALGGGERVLPGVPPDAAVAALAEHGTSRTAKEAPVWRGAEAVEVGADKAGLGRVVFLGPVLEVTFVVGRA